MRFYRLRQVTCTTPIDLFHIVSAHACIAHVSIIGGTLHLGANRLQAIDTFYVISNN